MNLPASVSCPGSGAGGPEPEALVDAEGGLELDDSADGGGNGVLSGGVVGEWKDVLPAWEESWVSDDLIEVGIASHSS